MNQEAINAWFDNIGATLDFLASPVGLGCLGIIAVCVTWAVLKVAKKVLESLF
jgi:hypothetical protein